jgi:hypothetical protein
LVGWRWPQGTYSGGVCGCRYHRTFIHDFGCVVFIDTLSYGSALLEELLTFMGSVEDY